MKGSIDSCLVPQLIEKDKNKMKKFMDRTEYGRIQTAMYENKIPDFLDSLMLREIPQYIDEVLLSDKPPIFGQDNGDFTNFKDTAISMSGKILVSEQFIADIANYIGPEKRVLEVMAGSGYLSAALETNAVNIVRSVDDHKGDYQKYYDSDSLWYDVEKVDSIEAIQNTDFDVILCAWPGKDRGVLNILKEAKAKNPSCEFIYIGEPDGGDADNEFFDYIFDNNMVDDDISVELSENIQNWESECSAVTVIK